MRPPLEAGSKLTRAATSGMSGLCSRLSFKLSSVGWKTSVNVTCNPAAMSNQPACLFARHGTLAASV